MWTSFALFTLVSALTPGPGNLLMLASGLNMGARNTLPLVLGVHAGFVGMLVLAGLGVGAAVQGVPCLEQAMIVAGAAYLLWLAWKLAHVAPGAGMPGADARLGFWQGLLLQAFNPKAWMASLMVGGLYLQGREPLGFAAVILVFLLLSLPCSLAWVMGGAMFAGVRAHPGRLVAVNRILAATLVASAILVLMA